MASGSVTMESVVGCLLLSISEYECENFNRENAHISTEVVYNLLQRIYGALICLHGL